MKKKFLLAFLPAVLLSSCATTIVRTESRPHSTPVYPATAFDGEFVWETSVKGRPLAPTCLLHRLLKQDCPKNGPIGRLAALAAGIIDLPFSLVSDTLVLPKDIWVWHRTRNDQTAARPSPATDN